jgi:hypothetical protein
MVRRTSVSFSRIPLTLLTVVVAPAKAAAAPPKNTVYSPASWSIRR